MKHLIRILALLLIIGIAPSFATAATKKHHKKKHHVTVHTTAMTPTPATPGGDPHTVPGKAVKKTKQVGHKISYTTWKLTHPNQARAEYDAEQAADAKREAQDRQHEAEYKATHK